MAITPEEKLKKLDNEISQLRARKQAIINKEKQKQKKERSSRLFKYGELIERLLNCEDIPLNQLEEILVEICNLAEKHLNCEGTPSDKLEEYLKRFVKILKENAKK